jgi:hypothetical protein
MIWAGSLAVLRDLEIGSDKKEFACRTQVIRGFSINNSHTHEVWSYDKHKECCGIVISLIEDWFDIVEELVWELVWWQWFAFFFAAQAALSFFFLWGYLTKHMGFSWSVFLQCEHWSDNNINFDLSQRPCNEALIILHSSLINQLSS